MNDSDAYIGPETAKAVDNFAFSPERIDTDLIRALAMVKLAAARVNRKLGYLSDVEASGIESVCEQIIGGAHHELIVCDPYQGGAGTSLNMNINEAVAMLANRMEDTEDRKAPLQIDPLKHVNLHQSTNDVFPTAVRIAVLLKLKALESGVAMLQEALQEKEREFADIIKMGRTELQDAVPMTLGMEFGAWAEAISRDRWRIFKSRERIKTINLGGTAIGTGLGAPREYIFAVTAELKRVSGLSISRAENLVDQTQNLDTLVEVSAMTKALGVNLLKLANDLKLLSSGPDTGYGEIRLPELQKGSSIMPGKVNPVMPEAICQIALKAINDDNLIALAAAHGQLELNAYLPLIAHTLLGSLSRLNKGCELFASKCISGIQANADKCREGVLRSRSVATFLLPLFGYESVENIVAEAVKTNSSIRDVVLGQGLMSAERFDDLMNPRRMYKLGFSAEDYENKEDK